MDSGNLHTYLKRHFGYDRFRPLQEEIIRTALSGGDALVLMPTGGGKSVCYQLPALVFEGVTIVVSPLISLMKDQVDALRGNGIEAASINSTTNYDEVLLIRQQCSAGTLKLIYLSPERLKGELAWLTNAVDVSLIAIDEAHCISQWGHDFRPEYTQLSYLKQSFPRVPVMALTATADKIIRADIVAQLQLSEPQIFVSSFDRPNLSLNVVYGLDKRRREQFLLSFLDKHDGESGIIYCQSRAKTEAVTAFLVQHGVEARAYHAGLSAQERMATQNSFLVDQTQVVCATIAFGMGIDKSNVRWVIHNNLPKSIENYYQEIGRSGRDGAKADTVLFYNLADLILLNRFAEESGQSELNGEKLRRMQQYAEASVCRRRILLSYFGEESTTDCGNCDVCKNPPRRFDGTVIVQKALSAVIRTQERVGVNLLIDILRGSHRQEILALGYHQLKTFGMGADISFVDWREYVLQMVQMGFVEVAYNDRNVLRVTPLGWKILKGEEQAMLAVLQLKDFTVKQSARQRKVAAPKSLLTPDEQLFETLRGLRSMFAKEADVPAYVIFSDKTLYEMVLHKPATMLAFSTIEGVGDVKLEKYGKEFVRAIRKELGVKTTAGDTYIETHNCLQQGMSVDEVAQFRKISTTTVYSHIAYLVSKGAIDNWAIYLSWDDFEQIKQGWLDLGKPKEVRPLFDLLKGEIEFGKLRLGIAIAEQAINKS